MGDPDGTLWAAGRTLLTGKDTGHALLLHLVGGRWTKVDTPSGLRLINRLVATPGGVTATAEDRATGSTSVTRLAGGEWTPLVLPSAGGQTLWINGLSVTPSGRLDVVGAATADADGTRTVFAATGNL